MADNTLTLVVPEGMTLGTLAASLFPNLESYAGQVMTTPPLMSAKEEGRRSRRDVVRAARSIERQSEHIRGGIDKKTDYTVGSRLRVHPRPDFESLGITDPEAQDKLVRSMNREFRNWGYDPRFLQDGEGHCDFGAMMWMAFRGVTGADGECALVIHYDEKRRKEFGGRWATYVDLVDPDRIDTPAKYTGNKNIVDGIVLDPRGSRRIGFFVQKVHPSDQITDASDLEFELVPRETPTGRPVGVHFFVKRRPSQLRGLSTLVAVIKQTGMVDKFDDAYLAAAIINQVLATWIETDSGTEQTKENIAPAGEDEEGITSAWGLFQQKLGYYDKAKIRIGNARVPVMPMGDKIHMDAADRAIPDPTKLRDGFLRMMSSALGLSFEQLAQRFGDSNFSAARAAFEDAMIGILRDRYLFGIAVPAQVYAAVIEEAWVKGRLDIPAGAPDFYENRTAYVGCDITGPAKPQVDPVKEANADKINLENKTTSRQDIIASNGKDYVDVFDQIAKERQEAEERGFTLDPLAPGTPGAAGAAPATAADAEEEAAAEAEATPAGQEN
ncbi:MAG: phage portal protein [Rhizorhabdus sp.]